MRDEIKMDEKTDQLFSVRDFAEQNGLRKQTVFKVLKRLGINASKSRGNDQSRGQLVSYITGDDARRILDAVGCVVRQEVGDADLPFASLYDIGVFYLLCLEPKHDPGRFKVGFAVNISNRLRQLRCSAPFARIIRTWPCRGLWEKTAIESVTNGCERLHTEVFRASSLESVGRKCDEFFGLMPIIAESELNDRLED